MKKVGPGALHMHTGPSEMISEGPVRRIHDLQRWSVHDGCTSHPCSSPKGHYPLHICISATAASPRHPAAAPAWPSSASARRSHLQTRAVRDRPVLTLTAPFTQRRSWRLPEMYAATATNVLSGVRGRERGGNHTLDQSSRQSERWETTAGGIQPIVMNEKGSEL